MSCNKLSIVKGEDRSFFVKLKSCINESKEPFDLSLATAIKAIFKGTSGVNVEVTLAAAEIVIIGSPTLGKIEIKISDVKSALLLTGADQSFEIEIDLGTEKRIVQVKSLLTVINRI